MSPTFTTLVEMLRSRAASSPDVAYVYLVDGEDEELRVTYRQMDVRARAIAADLQSRNLAGSRALLLFPPNEQYIDAFFGCLYAGVVPVPAYPPDPTRIERSLPRLFAIFEDAQASTILTTRDLVDMGHGIAAASPALQGVEWIATDVVPDARAEAWVERAPRTGDLAFLQYTSGSTSSPRGVRLTHANLVSNLATITDAFGIAADSVGLTWLPPYHDMGLIGGLLAPMYNGLPTLCMSPLAFLQRPARWPLALSKHRATISGGPNFAYELLIRKVSPSEMKVLDLSSWKVAFCGAEPVRADTMARFAKTFADVGFRASALYPCYGLAESTLIVSGGPAGRGAHVQWFDAQRLGKNEVAAATPATPEAKALVCAGRVLPGYEAVIVDPVTRIPSSDGAVGEVWLRGPSVADGYWRRGPAESETFGACLAGDDVPHLRTGDLGFLRDGDLYPTGRVKDLVIVRGRNYYPQDIEATVEAAHGAIRRGCCAVVADVEAREERLIVFAEVERRYHERRASPRADAGGQRRGGDRRSAPPDAAFVENVAPFDPASIQDVIRTIVGETHGVAPHHVVLLRPGSVRKTSSGKVQRRETLQAYRRGELGVLFDSAIETEAPRSLEDLETAVHSSAPRSSDSILSLIVLALRSMLGSTPIDVDAPMSALGLDSLQSIQVAHALQSAANVHVPHSAFLRATTIRQIAKAITGRAYGNLPPLATPLLESTVSTRGVPLTIAQQAMVHLQRSRPDRVDYNVSTAFEVEWNRPRLQDDLVAALRAVVERHPMLRVRLSDGVEPRLLIGGDVATKVVDARGSSPEQRAELARRDALRPFDLDRDPLVRLSIYAARDDLATVVMVAHHLVVDMWSLVVVLRDLCSTLAESAPTRTERHVGFDEYVAWQSVYLASDAAAASLAYWRGVLGGAPASLGLRAPTGRIVGSTSEDLGLGESLTSRVRGLARSTGTTSVAVLLAAFAVALGAAAGSDDVIVGVPVANRPLVEFADTVGYCANVIPVRIRCDPASSFSELLGVARAAMLDALEHQFVPLPSIVREVHPHRGGDRLPLLQAVLSVETPHLHLERDLVEVALGRTGVTASLGALRFTSLPTGVRPAPFEVVLTMVDGNAEIAGSIAWVRDHVADGVARGIAALFESVLKRATSDPDLSVYALREADATEARTPPPAQPAPDVPSLLEARGRATPDAIAVRQGDVQITYRVLLEHAHGVASVLRARGIGAESLVAVCVAPGPEMVVLQLGAWLAGAAFVSLDARQPVERIARIVAASGAELVVTEGPLASMAESSVSSRDLLEAARLARSTRGSPRAPSSTAYVIYTSGSTGDPKGVAVTHRGLANLVQWHATTYAAEAPPVASTIASPAFDASVWEIWGTLGAGGTLVVPARGFVATSAETRALWDQHGVTVAFAPTPLAEALFDEASVESLDVLLTGGDALRRWPRDRRPRVVNHYGPTEASVVATACALDAADAGGALPPIGSALPGVDAVVVDRELRVCGAEVRGQLALGGECLARGYVGDPAATAEKWVPDPRGGGRRIYLTGDVVTKETGGTLWFGGRADHQVKILGHRIEPAEVESAISACAGVGEAAVTVARGRDGAQRLIAFVAPNGVDERGLRAELTAKLPAFMVPSRFVALQRLPLSTSGKLDRRALAAMALALPDAERRREPPVTSLERLLAGVWSEILGVADVGATDDFFELGGHSLAIGRVARRLGELLDVEIPLQRLVRCSTIRDVCAALSEGGAGADLEARAEVALQILEMSDDEAAALVEAAADG